MRNAHHMNAPGACSVQTARAVTRGENWQFSRTGGVAISTVEVGGDGVIPAAWLASPPIPDPWRRAAVQNRPGANPAKAPISWR